MRHQHHVGGWRSLRDCMTFARHPAGYVSLTRVESTCSEYDIDDSTVSTIDGEGNLGATPGSLHGTTTGYDTWGTTFLMRFGQSYTNISRES